MCVDIDSMEWLTSEESIDLLAKSNNNENWTALRKEVKKISESVESVSNISPVIIASWGVIRRGKPYI